VAVTPGFCVDVPIYYLQQRFHQLAVHGTPYHEIINVRINSTESVVLPPGGGRGTNEPPAHLPVDCAELAQHCPGTTENIFLTFNVINFLGNVASRSKDLFQHFNWPADKPSIPPVRVGFVHDGLPHFCNFPAPCMSYSTDHDVHGSTHKRGYNSRVAAEHQGSSDTGPERFTWNLLPDSDTLLMMFRTNHINQLLNAWIHWHLCALNEWALV
jgi:hypothetical protein